MPNENLKLNVFISWSGERAGKIGEELRSWLTVGFQFTEPFLSKDIGAGKRWNKDLAEALDRSNFGILVLTPENMSSDWILFEAGALAKHLGESRVVPLLVDIEPKHLRLPLADFMAKRLDKEMFDVVRALNDAQPDPWDGELLRKTFDWTYDQFSKKVQKVLRDSPPPNAFTTPSRSTEDMIQEVLQIVKSLPASEREQSRSHTEEANEQFYPVGDRILLYKFLKERVKVPLYRNASMPALFEAAANFIQQSDSTLSQEASLTIVAQFLVSERPLKDLLDGLHGYEAAGS